MAKSKFASGARALEGTERAASGRRFQGRRLWSGASNDRVAYLGQRPPSPSSDQPHLQFW